LTENDLFFHKFLDIGGRTLKPILVANNPNHPTQHMWSDAFFIKDIFKLSELPTSKLLKMGIIAFIYHSPDVAYQCFKIYDKKTGNNIHKQFFELGDQAKR
jgi:hypothetical protein